MRYKRRASSRGAIDRSVSVAADERIIEFKKTEEEVTTVSRMTFAVV